MLNVNGKKLKAHGELVETHTDEEDGALISSTIKSVLGIKKSAANSAVFLMIAKTDFTIFTVFRSGN